MNQRATPKQWQQARLYFESGQSLRDISKQTRIDHSSINKKAKKEGWQRNLLPQLAENRAKLLQQKQALDEQFSTLPPPQQEIVEKMTLQCLVDAQFFMDKGKEVIDLAMKSLRDNPTPLAARTTMQTLHTGMAVTGVVPYRNTSNANQPTLCDVPAESVVFNIIGVKSPYD